MKRLMLLLILLRAVAKEWRAREKALAEEIEAFLAKRPELSEGEKKALKEGKVWIGMSQEELDISQRNERNRRSFHSLFTAAGTTEIWTYRTYGPYGYSYYIRKRQVVAISY